LLSTRSKRSNPFLLTPLERIEAESAGMQNAGGKKETKEKRATL
jgi:hypothetical protein